MEYRDDVLDHVLSLLPEVSRRLSVQTPFRGDFVSVPVGQARAMSYLFQHGGSSLSDVAAGIGVSLATASELVERLVEAGHVERAVNPKDRRQVQLSLTPEAVALCQDVRATQREQLRAVAADIAPEDWAAFVRGLTAVAEGVRNQTNARHEHRQ
jgi:DNA-binding MarR family transcriptional regulator